MKMIIPWRNKRYFIKISKLILFHLNKGIIKPLNVRYKSEFRIAIN